MKRLLVIGIRWYLASVCGNQQVVGSRLVMGIGRFVLTNGLPDNYPVKKFDQTNTDKCSFLKEVLKMIANQVRHHYKVLGRRSCTKLKAQLL